MASEVAREVLEEVLGSVLDSYEMVILLRVKNRPVPSLCLTQAIAAQGLDVMETLEFKDSRGAIVPLTHLKVIKQHVLNLCGHHSLYNVLYILLQNSEDLTGWTLCLGLLRVRAQGAAIPSVIHFYLNPN